MTDPYKVLQVSPDASDDEVKAAYRELVRKYHPDNFNGNPLSDLATEKMQEINLAYDEIVASRKDGGRASSYTGADSAGYGKSQFADIRRMINMRRITEAEELLDGVPREKRDAEWHFLKGTIQQFRGWLDEAYENYAAACNMEPANAEYKTAFSQLQWQRQTARPAGAPYRTAPAAMGGCSICDVCSAMICADCLCDCCGGGC